MKTRHFLLVAILMQALFACENQAEPIEQKTETKIENEGIDYLAIGQGIAAEAQQTLGGNLMREINAGGTLNAIPFCSLNAIKITDSVALKLNTSIQRVTDLPRNSKNKGNQKELDYILKLKAKGENYEPKIQEIDGQMVGYYPIVTNDMCLKCHGNEKTDIEPSTLKKIKELYPNDKATAYHSNEIRGLWVVKMTKK